jgi:GntR family transcriptional regulator
VEKIIPFVTTLTGKPDQRGGEGDTYLREVAAKRRKPDVSDPRIEIQKARSELARELHLKEGATVVSRHQERRIDGTPWSLQTSFYPLSLVEQGATLLTEASDIKQGTVTYLSETIGVKQAGYRDTITVRSPNGSETRFFRLPDDGRVSVIETRRTAFDEGGSPIRLTVSVYPADRNQFAIVVGRVPDEFVDSSAADAEGPQLDQAHL